jgi:predicted component of type VI protein secretion system
MTTLRLFHRNDPFRQIEARAFAGGELTIGREPEDGWRIDDPSMTLSRRHCVIVGAAEGLGVRDTSANGVFLGRARTRAPQGATVPLDGDTVHLGEFTIVVEDDAAPGAAETAVSCGLTAPFDHAILAPAAVTQADLAIPDNWSGQGAADDPSACAAPSLGADASLEAFCRGARLPVSAFSGADPAEVMRRLGAVYQQMVLGLTELMHERTSVRGEFRLDRTAVKAQGNNPFRWAGAERVAVDLLRVSDAGFLIGPAAVRASFGDVKKHLASILAGLRGAIGAALDALSPAALEPEAGGVAFLKSRAAQRWATYVERHEQLRSLADHDPQNPFNRAFRVAYQRQLDELDAAAVDEALP